MPVSQVHIVELKPALVSIPDARAYLGSISRAGFYARILPLLDSVMVGHRRMVTLESLDRYITLRKTVAA